MQLFGQAPSFLAGMGSLERWGEAAFGFPGLWGASRPAPTCLLSYKSGLPEQFAKYTEKKTNPFQEGSLVDGFACPLSSEPWGDSWGGGGVLCTPWELLLAPACGAQLVGVLNPSLKGGRFSSPSGWAQKATDGRFIPIPIFSLSLN